MQCAFIIRLKPFLDAVAQQAELFAPKKSGEYYIFSRYDPASEKEIEFNPIRTCTSAKEFLFPFREQVAASSGDFKPSQVRPFAVFGLKECDIRAIQILDKVFQEEEFEDPFLRGLLLLQLPYPAKP